MPQIEVLQGGDVLAMHYRCTAGPEDQPYPEVFWLHSLSFVRRGSFSCRFGSETVELIAGAILVGHPGKEYECAHEHHCGGDECLSFQYSSEIAEELCGPAGWHIGSLPPLAEMMVLGELGQAIAEGRCDLAFDELGLLFASRFAQARDGERPRAVRPTARDRRRAIEAALWIDAHSSESIDLARVASMAGISSYHFLRLFSRVLNVSPHQYLVRSRLRRAASLLIDEALTITDVALESGFNDISNFVRTFHRAAGMSPGAFRRAARDGRKIFQDRLTIAL